MPGTSKDCVPMMTITSVLELALTVSPTLIPTETIVPLMGLVRLASASDCWATVSSACAVSMAAWSAAICSGVSVRPSRAATGWCRPCLPSVLPVPPLPVLPVSSRRGGRQGRGRLGGGAGRCPTPGARRGRARAARAAPCRARSRARPCRLDDPGSAPGTARSRPWPPSPDRRTPAAGPSRPVGARPRSVGPGRSWWWRRGGGGARPQVCWPGPGRPLPSAGRCRSVASSWVRVVWSWVIVRSGRGARAGGSTVRRRGASTVGVLTCRGRRRGARLVLLVLDQLGLVGVQGGLGRGDRLAQRRRVEGRPATARR